MKLKWIAVSLFALSLALIVPSKTNASGSSAGEPGAAAAQDRDRGGWDTVPDQYRDVQRQGFHDGIEGAHKDFENHRRPDVENRDEYRHPHVPSNERHDYREGYREGYQRGVEHLFGHNHY